ncbi:hypothetical protein KM043_005520 [Ampulex compressa]|nr:hypothetical protein KM043_005520 [Ampulex compressa]
MGKKEVLQAVVLADDFTTNLNPMQNIFPSVLMPVINIHLLDYLLETLIRCLGDALRDIDTKGWIRGYFILIRGDAFINADLKSALDMHYTKAQKDKGATMTMVLRNIGSTKEFLLKEEASLVVSDKTNKKILYYSKLRQHEKKIKLELNWFLDHSEIEISTCFLDTHVYLCSPSVLPLFADNFDFQTMEDFIRGVLMNEEILDSRIYWQQLNHEDYSLPISSWEAYRVLNRDILHRHSFPLTPDAFPSLKNFVYMPRSTYKHRSAILAKGCVLEKDCILGKNSVLGSNTCITESVIGDNCIIGSDFVKGLSRQEDAQDDCLRAIEEVAGTTKQQDMNDTHSKKVRAAAQPFIKWLEEAEEGSTQSEED